MIDKLLLGNLRFRESDFTPNIDHYRELAGSQHPTTLWIGCSDSRLQIEHLYTYPLLKKAVDEKRVEVHGLYYDLGTGMLSRVK